MFLTWLNYGLRDEAELHAFVRIYLHYSIPQHAVCPGHVAPFRFLADQYFEKVKTVFGFANRNGGKTLIVAILNVVESLFKPGIEIVSSAAIKNQADKCYEYVTQMLFGDPLLTQTLVSSLRSSSEFYNGSKLALVTGSWHGLNSPHPQKFRCDEIELMHHTILQEGLQMSISSQDGRWKAGDCLTSTRKFAAGTVQRLLDDAEKKNVHIYSWCIWEILEPCTRQCKGDPEFGDCPAYARLDKDGKERPLCHGKAHDLPEGGFYKIEDFVKKVSLLDLDTWETQWLNLRPQGGSLVYGEYYKDEPPYVVPTAEAEDLLARAKEQKWARVIGIDFGSNFHASYWMWDPWTKVWYAYGEYWFSAESDLPLSKHARNIKGRDPLGWSNRTQVFADPSGRQAIRDMENEGLIAVGANNALYEGINHLKKLLERRPDGTPGLRVFSSCERLRKELSALYVHALKKDGTVNKDQIVKKDDHACDSSRYALFSFETIGTAHYKLKKLRGVW